MSVLKAKILVNKLKTQVAFEETKENEFNEKDYYVLIDPPSARTIVEAYVIPKPSKTFPGEIQYFEYLYSTFKTLLGIKTLITNDIEGIELVKRIRRNE
jgi:hypothetical protein